MSYGTSPLEYPLGGKVNRQFVLQGYVDVLRTSSLSYYLDEDRLAYIALACQLEEPGYIREQLDYLKSEKDFLMQDREAPDWAKRTLESGLLVQIYDNMEWTLRH